MFETFFKAIGEPTRLKILRLLVEEDLCVCDIEEVLQMSQPRISQHLKVLKQAGLVGDRKEGQKTICNFNHSAFTENLEEFQRFMFSPIEEIKNFEDEVARLMLLDGTSCEKKLN
ncbi:MAG TPA: metalloregulator ArsR/SmtB family transcription factor [Syntrophomonadaceae bacterium]|nr:metalloregulator ArsR/SmtB family transcription factor [Syntrophomonadaceae bacterium]